MSPVAAKADVNKLVVKVTNLWPTGLIGDETVAGGCGMERHALKEWPQWFLDGKPSPTGRLTFTTCIIGPRFAAVGVGSARSSDIAHGGNHFPSLRQRDAGMLHDVSELREASWSAVGEGWGHTPLLGRGH